MSVFVDTSALYAFLDRSDQNHGAAKAWLSGTGRDLGESLLTHNHVVVETAALVHRRLGAAAVRALLEDLLPITTVVFVDEPLHRAAVSAFVASRMRRASLVDWVSFELMRHRGIAHAFAFDRDFDRAGFTTLP